MRSEINKTLAGHCTIGQKNNLGLEASWTNTDNSLDQWSWGASERGDG